MAKPKEDPARENEDLPHEGESGETEGITVNLDKKEEKKPEPQGLTPDQLEKMQKRMEYQARQFEKAMKKIEDLATTFGSKVQPQQTPQPQTETDELDRMVEQGNWKDAVLALGKKAAEEILTEKEIKNREESQRAQLEGELEKSRKRVLERYPNIEDDEAEEHKLYLQVINENPTLLSNVYGPELAMYKMEEKLRDLGKTPASYRQAVNEQVDAEVQRRARIGAASAPAGRPASSPNVVVLTAEEKRQCEENGIPLEVFARMKQMSSRDFREGVSAS